MSIKTISQVWDNSQASGSSLLILLAMSDYADHRGICFPSVATLASKGRVDERTARRALRSLEKLGEIVCIKKGGGDRASVYKIVIKERESNESEDAQESMPQSEEGAECPRSVGTMSGEGGQSVRQVGAQCPPNLILTLKDNTNTYAHKARATKYPESHYTQIESSISQAYFDRPSNTKKEAWLNHNIPQGRKLLKSAFQAGKDPEEMAVKARQYILEADGVYQKFTIDGFIKNYNSIGSKRQDTKADRGNAAAYDVGRV